MNQDSATLKKDPKTGASFSLTLGLGGIIGSLVVIFAGLAFMFGLGVFLGRGYDPATAVPGLGRFMPEPASSDPPRVVSAQEAEGTGTPPPSAGPAPTPPPGDDSAPPAAPSSSAGAGRRTQTPAPNASGAGTAPAPVTPPSSGVRQNRPPAGAQRFRYVFQVAAYTGAAPCDSFVAKLRSAGFAARTQKDVEASGTWYRAMVDVTGDDKDADAFRTRIRAQGVSGPLLRSKKPLR